MLIKKHTSARLWRWSALCWAAGLAIFSSLGASAQPGGTAAGLYLWRAAAELLDGSLIERSGEVLLRR
jgi:hypothetical protein